MRKVLVSLRRGLLYVAALVLVAGSPLSAIASAQEPVEEVTPVAPEEPALTYTYDADSQKWNSEKWQFNPQTGAYEPTPVPVIIEPAPVSDEDDSTVDKTIDTTVEVDTKVQSGAASGDALISKNTTAGSALSGDASAAATIMNSVNSSVATSGNQKIVTFTQDIMGDVHGDLMLYPLMLKAMLEAKSGESATNPSSTTVNATTNTNLNNTINVTAKSGDATVDSNTKAGDATTGSAAAMANVVNIINSMVAADNSFIGTINIYGSLEGDILVAPDFIPQLLASNGGEKDSSSLQVSKQDTTTIVNNITAVAESGAASIFGNTKAGDGTSGAADSNVVIFNITGHEIVAEDSMLVFVNVLGRWVGMIVDAPNGATAAMLGTGVTKNEAHAPDLVLNTQTNHGITNTIAVTAESGDATISNNTEAGNAKSGSATAMANVANISNSSINLSGWFKMLFINITGDWRGAFGVKTAWGDSPAPIAEVPQSPLQFIPAKDQPVATPQPKIQLAVVDSRLASTARPIVEDIQSVESVLASTISKPTSRSTQPVVDSAPLEASYDFRYLIIAGSLFVIGASAIGIRRLLRS